MKAALVFSAKSSRTKKLSECIAIGLKENGFETESIEIDLFEKKTKDTEPELSASTTDVSSFDLVVFGSQVFGLMPKRKISKAIEAFIKQCSGLDGKKIAVFLTCFGIPGTALKKIQAMLQTRNAKVLDSMIVAYLLGLSEQQLEQAKEFGKRLAVVSKN